MSLLSDASLVMIPSGYKDGKLYSVKPTNGDGDFTFSRGSNLAATRVNSEGLIEKGRENLLLQSNTFDTTWSLSNGTLTGGQTGYGGSSDAWQFAASGTAQVSQSVSTSGLQTFSVYAKSGTENGLFLRANGGSNPRCFFNLDSGTIGSEAGGLIDSKMVDVGNGWYRCSIVYSDTINEARIYVGNNSNGFPSSGNIYIQDAQLEVGLVATDYIETTTTTEQAGILEDMPRLDYSGGTCPALLLEPQRTNVVTQSEYINGLSKSNNPIITQNYAISPEGVQNAFRIQDPDGSTFRRIESEISISGNPTYTISVYVKKATSPITTYGGFFFDFDGNTRKISNLIFDEYNGTLVNATGNAITSIIHPVIDKGDYWRFSATATDTGSNTLLRTVLRAGASANGTSISLAIKDYTAYGFQAEEGSYPTSYIPTYGSAVTKNQDNLALSNLQSKSLFGIDSGFIFYEFDSIDDLFIGWNILNTKDRFQYIDIAGSLSGYFRFRGYESNITLQVVNLGASPSSLIIPDGSKKVCISWNASSFSLFADGSKIGTMTTTSSISVNSISNFDGNLGNKEALLKKMLWGNTNITDEEAIALTTI